MALMMELLSKIDVKDPRELLILSLKREVRLLRMENNYLRQQVI
jgi:hypothetical protein